ncbi:MAG: hydrogenase maturation protease [bacterium]
MKILVLGLGNPLLSDDGIGFLAAKILREKLLNEADVAESSLSGVALLDLFIGYDRAVIIDAIQTNRNSPGTILELIPSDFDAVVSPSPHYAGLPEILALADRLGLHFPTEIRILAVEVEDPYTIGGDLSEPVKKALPELIRRAQSFVKQWCDEMTQRGQLNVEERSCV